MWIVLFRKTVARNTELEARVEELERELSVWKAALKTADEEKKALNKSVLRLERNIGSLKVSCRSSAPHLISLSYRKIIPSLSVSLMEMETYSPLISMLLEKWVAFKLL